MRGTSMITSSQAGFLYLITRRYCIGTQPRPTMNPGLWMDILHILLSTVYYSLLLWFITILPLLSIKVVPVPIYLVLKFYSLYVLCYLPCILTSSPTASSSPHEPSIINYYATDTTRKMILIQTPNFPLLLSAVVGHKSSS
jgi:hypothetical protein